MGFERIMIEKPKVVIGDQWCRNSSSVCIVRELDVITQHLQNVDAYKIPTREEKSIIVYNLSINVSWGYRSGRDQALALEYSSILAKALDCQIEYSQCSC